VRLESFKVRGFGPFKKEWSCDLSELRGLVAVTGVNGAGKSTFLELGLPGALYRQTPTRGSLGDLAVARDACLDVTVVNGARWQIRHLVDGQSGKSEALVLGADGQPALPDSKVKSYDAWASKHWPAPEVLMATIFGAQGSGGFLAAKPAERKAILLRMLGVERLEGLATQAREEAKVARQRVDTTVARLADERARGGNVAELETELKLAKASAERAHALVEAAKATLETGHVESARVAQLQQANDDLARRRTALADQREAAAKKLADVEERLANNRQRLSEGDAIRAAVARLEALGAELAEAERAVAAAEAEARETLAPWLDVNERIRAEEQRLQRADEKLRDARAVERAKLEVQALRDAAAEADAAVSRATTKLEELAATHLAGAEEREREAIKSHVAIVGAVEVNPDAAPEDLAAVSREAIEANAAAVALAAALPGQQKETRERLAAAKGQQAEAQRQLATAERYAARGPEMDQAAVDQTEAQAELQRLRSGYAAAGVAAKEKQGALPELRAKVARLGAERDSLKPTADKAGKLEGCKGRIDELEPVAAGLRGEITKLDREASELPAPAELPPAPPLATLRERVQDAERESAGAARMVAGLEQRLEQARASAARQVELEDEERRHSIELADWTRVASSLGKDGLQALEIDAAGPALTELTNAILHRAHGPRFTVRVETQRLSADGKRQLEGCEVMVLDTVQGREAAGETFSGGERVVIAESLSLAILVLSCRRAGLTDVSLVRDESGAALDPGNARVYVEMLRHAIELTGARHCLLVSHMPEVQELCDSRIEVGQ
jgi:exonuclease SbcC